MRGGSPDQNLILLDGVPVYNISHLFGFVSVFNPDAVSNVQLYNTFGNQKIVGNEMVAYVEDEFNAGERLMFNLGLHFSGFQTSDAFYPSIEPRISARYKANSQRFQHRTQPKAFRKSRHWYGMGTYPPGFIVRRTL